MDIFKRIDAEVRPLPQGHLRPPRCNAGGCLDCSSYQGGRRRASMSNRSALQTDAARNKTGSKV